MRRRVMVKLFNTEAIVSNEACKALNVREEDLIRHVYLSWLDEQARKGFEELEKQKKETLTNGDVTE